MDLQGSVWPFSVVLVVHAAAVPLFFSVVEVVMMMIVIVVIVVIEVEIVVIVVEILQDGLQNVEEVSWFRF